MDHKDGWEACQVMIYKQVAKTLYDRLMDHREMVSAEHFAATWLRADGRKDGKAMSRACRFFHQSRVALDLR